MSAHHRLTPDTKFMMTTANPAAEQPSTAFRGRARSRPLRQLREGLIRLLLLACAMFSIATTIGIVLVLFSETFGTRWLGSMIGVEWAWLNRPGFFSFEGVSFWEFITGGEWNPLLGSEQHFGIWPLICGTMLVTGVAMVIAIPLGLITAVFMSEYAPKRLRNILKPVLEVLAGVPTVVYGFFALTVITPFLRSISDGFDVYNATSAGIAVGIMCLPIVTSISEDALQSVPRALREGAYGLGGTKFDVSVRVVVPAGLSGIVAASLLAIARAVGETMIVALAAGNLAQLTLDPRGQTQTMTAYMVQIFLGDVSNLGVEYYSSYAVAATLFTITLILTLIGQYIRIKFREEYE